ncbi:MAG TPA: POTRA domain-containing protein, partial [Polyangiales bacterium]|nr:POTRA domain-containing protein [Polyangiales bacterium]
AGGARLLTALQNDGYAFAKVDPPVAYENPAERVLDLTFQVVAGPRVKIGDIQLQGLGRVSDKIVRRRLLLHTGDQYSATAVERARKDVLSLGVFAAADVQLGSKPDDLGRVPVTFRFRERPRHAVSMNAAYSTDLGTSAGVRWTDRNFRGDAQQLELAAQVINLGGTATTGIGYNVSARYLLPQFAHRDQSLQFAVGALEQQLDAYDQKAATAGVTLNRKLSTIWSAGIGLSAIRETIIQQGITQNYTLLSVPLTGTYDTTNLASPLNDPTHGMRASLTFSPTFARGGQGASFIVGQASVTGYFDLQGLLRTGPGRSVVAMRTIAGSAFGAGEVVEEIGGADISVPNLPPDQRFYAGGSG